MDESRRKVNLIIADKSYNLVAKSDDEEHYMRLAADKINELYVKFNQKYTNVPPKDKLAFVALNMTIAYLRSDDALQDIEGNLKGISRDLESYLDKIDNNR